MPSFDELRGPKRPAAAAPPSAELGEEEKTAQINTEVLQRALRQSQQGAPIEAPPKPDPLAITDAGKLPLAVPQRVPPPPPGRRPPSPADVTTDPETSPVARALPQAPPPGRPTVVDSPLAGAPTGPMPQIKPQTVVRTSIPGRAPPPPPGARPAPPPPSVQHVTEKMDPVTPDMINARRAEAARAAAPVQTSAPATPRPDPSLHQTQISSQHRGTTLPEPSPAAPGGTRSPGVTQPSAPNPFLSKRATEPPSGDKPMAPSLDDEPPTKNERPSRPNAAALDIEADIVSEVKKLKTGAELSAVTQPGVPDEPKHAVPLEVATQPGPVDLVEVIATPAPVGRRLGALLADALMLGVVDVVIALGVLAAGKAPPLPEDTGFLDAFAMRVSGAPKLVAAIAILSIGVAAAYATLFAVAWSGRTIGRRLFGLNLVDRRGAPPSPVRALVRALLAVFSFALGGMGFWWWLFDRRSQTLHDRICSTFVVRLKAGRS